METQSQVTTKRSARIAVTLRRILLGLIITLLALSGLGVAYQFAATELDRRNFPPPGQMEDVGGYQLHLYCIGEGSPTVILEHGGGGNVLAWFLVQPQVSQVTRVCAYDRGGLGWSDPGPEPRDGQHIAEELHTLLQNANIPKPFVLVGWSYGGLFARVYADLYPEDLAGLVLLDATHPEILTRTQLGQAQYQNESRNYAVARVLARFGLLRLLPNPFTTPPAGLSPEQREQWQAVYSTTKFWDATEAESRTILGTMAQVREADSFDDLPLIIVTAGDNNGVDGQWRMYQEELTSLSSQSVHVVVDGAVHTSLWLDPEDSQASSAAILQVVEAVRAGTGLKP